MPTEKILGTNIRFYREARGMTQEELAHELCLGSRTTLSNWESGYSSPDAEFLPQIANALHVSIDELFMGTYRNKRLNSETDDCYVAEIKHLLDEMGYISIETANRCREAIADELTERFEQERRRQKIAAKDEIVFPLFLQEIDEDYWEMQEKTRELRKLMRKNNYSYEELQKQMLLNNRRYDDHICKAYYYQIISGEKVPSRQLYERMKEVLSKEKQKQET